jgi:hypothetical protein
MTPGGAPSGSHAEHGHVSREVFEHLAAVHGEGDEWDFKETLGNLAENSVRVNLAKDALAFCNLPGGGTLVVGIADDYSRVGLRREETIDTTAIRNAVEKYIDGEFTVVAAEHELSGDGGVAKRYGIVHFVRRTAQPVLAATDGQVDGRCLFRSGDILIRRGAQSIRANSGDVRRLLTSTVVNEARVRAVDELWACVVEQRQLLVGAETVYDLLVDSEYPEAATRAELRAMVGSMSQLEHATRVQELQHRVSLVRPYLPDGLYEQYRRWSALVGRVQMKVVRQVAAGIFRPWTELDDSAPDLPLRDLASQILSAEEIEAHWAGRPTSLGVYRPLKPVFDLAEQGLLDLIRGVLSGLA